MVKKPANRKAPLLTIESIAAHLGKKPSKGGSPPRDSKGKRIGKGIIEPEVFRDAEEVILFGSIVII